MVNVNDKPLDVPAGCPAEAAHAYRRTLGEALDVALRRPDEVWVFGYASLIWRPEFDAVETRRARVVGWHRALRMRSRVNRGTPEQPGLVFALLGGGTCLGVASRMSPQRVRDELPQLWAREMPWAVYVPRWVRCRTDAGDVRALAFTLDRRHPSHTGALDDATLVNILRHARGRYGSTLDYLVETCRGLASVCIEDAEVNRLVAVARRAGLLPDGCSSSAQGAAPERQLERRCPIDTA